MKLNDFSVLARSFSSKEAAKIVTEHGGEPPIFGQKLAECQSSAEMIQTFEDLKVKQWQNVLQDFPVQQISKMIDEIRKEGLRAFLSRDFDAETIDQIMANQENADLSN